jgi:hypothetical protein
VSRDAGSISDFFSTTSSSLFAEGDFLNGRTTPGWDPIDWSGRTRLKMIANQRVAGALCPCSGGSVGQLLISWIGWRWLLGTTQTREDE